MGTTEKKSRILGLAFLIQFVTSFTGGVLVLPMATGVGGFGRMENIGQTMATIAKNAGLVRFDILLELVTAAAIIFLGGMLYAAVKKQNKGLALTAFGLYVMEGVMIAVTKLVLFALLAISQQYMAAGNPVSLEPTARMAYEVMSYSSKMFNFAACLGITIFYALLYKARTVARPLTLWGLVSIQGVFAGLLMGLFGLEAPIYLYVLYIPFELVIGVWILIRGVNREAVN
ncbi:MAG: DUF4386 domain-containing protein [Spirochaetia bacterium]|jgi:hypothetical protein